MNRTLQNLLISKTQNNKLANLYHLESYNKTNPEELFDWINQTLKSALNISSPENHQDILILTPEAGKSV